MQVLRAAERAATPWKNGGGFTREVAVWPQRSSFDDFHWRVSMAEVLQPGAFSSFAKVDRLLAVLEGRLGLAVAGSEDVELTAETPALAFPGDVAAYGRPIDGAVLDLNVMTRRGLASATLRRIEICPTLPLAPSQDHRLLIALTSMRLATFEVARHDAIWITPRGDGDTLVVAEPAPAWLVTISAGAHPS